MWRGPGDATDSLVPLAHTDLVCDAVNTVNLAVATVVQRTSLRNRWCLQGFMWKIGHGMMLERYFCGALCEGAASVQISENAAKFSEFPSVDGLIYPVYEICVRMLHIFCPNTAFVICKTGALFIYSMCIHVSKDYFS